ncbi:MAG TPA: hypothetical protein VD791_04345 [Burkholderiales bacterium]|nr:hypothetical protein [Burkholderiales bacterium]
MTRLQFSLLALLAALPTCAWAQQPPAGGDLGRQVRELQRQLAGLQSTVRSLRAQLAAEAAARQALQAGMETLTNQLAGLQSDVRGLRGNSILDLNGYLTLDHSSGYPTALFQGINVQVVNGAGTTHSANGLGNLIVGYNRPRAGRPVCSLGYYITASDCRAKGGVWARSHKSGSHNFVGGDFNSYSGWGGVVLGIENAINAPYAAITGGALNVASGDLSGVGGGSGNSATGMYGVVGGGLGNIAAGSFSALSGGARRMAVGSEDWVGGGLLQDQ